MNGNAPGRRQASLIKKGTTAIATADGTASGGGVSVTPSTAISLAAGDKISLQALQTTGAPVDAPGAALPILLLQRKGTR